MGVSKTEIFSKAHQELAQIGKVLSHPARVAILQYISQQKGCICTDLVAEIGLSQPTISQHLAEIKKLGLLKGTWEGKSLCYCIDKERWGALGGILQSFFNQIQTNKNCTS